MYIEKVTFYPQTLCPPSPRENLMETTDADSFETAKM